MTELEKLLAEALRPFVNCIYGDAEEQQKAREALAAFDLAQIEPCGFHVGGWYCTMPKNHDGSHMQIASRRRKNMEG